MVGELPLTRRTGTPVFMAPELYQRQYSYPADLWSCGMMLYQLLSGRFPFWCAHRFRLTACSGRSTCLVCLPAACPFLPVPPPPAQLAFRQVFHRQASTLNPWQRTSLSGAAASHMPGPMLLCTRYEARRMMYPCTM